MSNALSYRLEFLDPRRHDRRGFSCGEGELDIYLQRTAHRDAQHNGTVVYVLTNEDEPGRIAGYLTLAIARVALTSVAEAPHGRASSPTVTPATLIGRLAVAESLQGQGLGARLLQEACIKAVEAASEVDSAAVVVDPLHERAAAFYRRYGFAPLGDGQRMYLPMKTIIASLIAATGG